MLRAFRRKQVKKEADKILTEAKKKDEYPCALCWHKQDVPCTRFVSKKHHKPRREPGSRCLPVCSTCYLLAKQANECFLCTSPVTRGEVNVRGRRGFCDHCAGEYDKNLKHVIRHQH